MRGYKNFEGTPHPGDLCHLVEIGYTENAYLGLKASIAKGVSG